MDSAKRMVLIDGYAQIYRSFHAIQGLTGPAGEPTNALYGVARFLLRLEDRFPHTLGAMVLDKGAPRERLEILPEYKAQRPPMPDELRQQVEPIREWATASGWAVLEQEGCEADDLIAGIAAAVAADCEVLIVTHDKDLGQLVDGEHVRIVAPGKEGSFDVLGPAEVQAKFGVPPAAICDYLALVGDTSDNIPGVPGVGPKTAAALVAQFGSVEALLERLAEVSNPRIRELIAGNVEVLRRNLRLVRLPRVLPAEWRGIETLARRPPEWDRLLALARSHGLKSLVTALEKRRQDARNPTLF